MPDALPNHFVNQSRPQLQHSSVLEFPVELHGDPSCAYLEKSLLNDKLDGHARAASARLLECLLERHRLPFLLLRVADMRAALGCSATALTLYVELQSTLRDPLLGRWIESLRLAVSEETDKNLSAYKNDHVVGFTPSQRWVPTARDPYPTSSSIDTQDISDLRENWRQLECSTSNFQAQFLNMHCLETNYIEGTFQFCENDNDTLVQRGFYDVEALTAVKAPVGGEVRNLDEAILILRDTHEALNEIYKFVGPDPREITVELICQLHEKLMKTSRVLYNEAIPNGGLKYTNIGVTRFTTRVNVTASAMMNGKHVRIQFCPYDEVKGELELFCERLNEILRKDDMDPFACAAWISHTFISIHPFEDGNGRLSRILSSIPLVRKNLPPMCITMSFRVQYLLHLNNTRACPRSGNYRGLMRVLYFSTKMMVSMLILDHNATRRAIERGRVRGYVG